MLKKLWELTATILTLARDLQQYRQEQERTRRDLADLATIVRMLTQEIKHSQTESAQKYENLLLEIENRLLKHDRTLPPTRTKKKAAKKKS